MKQYLSILLIPTLLMGCYNIGSYTHYVQNDTVITTGEHKQIEHEHTRSTCPLYVPPVHAQLPEIPLDEIKRVSSKSDREVQAILASHIKALREYAVNRRREDELHYKRYLSECSNPLK